MLALAPPPAWERRPSGLYVPRRRPLPPIAGGAGSHVRELGTKASFAGAAISSFTLASTMPAISAGDTAIASFWCNCQMTAISVSDGTNSWNIDASSYNLGAAVTWTLVFASFYYPSGLSTGATLTFSWSTGTGGYYGASASEFSGLLAASYFDTSKFNAVNTFASGVTNSPTTGASGTLATANELIYAAVAAYASAATAEFSISTPGGSFTALTAAGAGPNPGFATLLPAWEDVATTAAVTFNPTLNQNIGDGVGGSDYYAGLVAYKAALAPFPPLPQGIPESPQTNPMLLW
jgi:hypothetical protein